MRSLKRDPRIAAAINSLLPDAPASLQYALAAEVENMILARLWDKMRGATGELNAFGVSVVNRIARDVYNQIHQEIKA